MAKDINVVRKFLFSEDLTTILFINFFALHFAFWRSSIEGNIKPHSSNYDIKVHGEEGEMKTKKSIAYMQKPKPRHVPPLCLDSTTRCREVFLFSQKAPTHEQPARISHCYWRCLLFAAAAVAAHFAIDWASRQHFRGALLIESSFDVSRASRGRKITDLKCLIDKSSIFRSFINQSNSKLSREARGDNLNITPANWQLD